MVETKESHEERTAHEPREAALHPLVLSKITPVGSLVRLLRLQIPRGEPDIHFLPGQWVDTFVPGIAKAGGFTITSAPSRAATKPGGAAADADSRYIELAVKKSPENPAAAWLWQNPPRSILGQTVKVRIGGSFVFPPATVPAASAASFLRDRTARVVFVAGGVGINPLISMVSHLGEMNDKDNGEEGGGPEVDFLYSVHEAPSSDEEDEEDSVADSILFLQRLASLFNRQSVRGRLKVFLTGGISSSSADGGDSMLSCNEGDVPCVRRRITTADLDAAVLQGASARDNKLDNVYVYVCGVPTMTDDFVAHLTSQDGGLGLAAHQVLYERWW